MWNIKRFTEKLHTDGCVMALGGFDGAHVGHKTLFARAKAYGLPVGVMTIAGGKGCPLFTVEERRNAFARLGLDFALELDFDEIREMTANDFARRLAKETSSVAFLCGEDFRFGYLAQGTPETLKVYTGLPVERVELVKVDGEKVSATKVKNLLSAGDTAGANALLGEPFFLLGNVEKDRGVGKSLGFPTANVRYPKGKFPLKTGVYETRVEMDGKAYSAVTNFGARPTFSDESVWTETHLIGFDGDLYGREIRVEFLRYLRPIEKFDGVEQLKEQLHFDVDRVKKGE